MAGFENYALEADQLEREIERKGVALGIDWSNAIEVRLLARDALACRVTSADFSSDDTEQRTRVELFGLAQLMLKVMEESAGHNIHTHGGAVWKSFAQALWAEHEIAKLADD